MTQPTSRSSEPKRPDVATTPTQALSVGSLWIGEHRGDRDILVLDPSEVDPAADVLPLYSLTEHRTRRFPRAQASEWIQVVTDEAARERAMSAYRERLALRGDHEQAKGEAQEARMAEMREGMIAAHQRYVERLGLQYAGVRKTADGRAGRATKCHSCEIALDDFVGACCAICSSMVCSCGACACGKPASVRRTAAKARVDQEAEA